MGNGLLTPPGAGGIQLALETLEAQLRELDRLGALKAAAHLDAAIQQLRRDQAATADRTTNACRPTREPLRVVPAGNP
ncbi:MAG: hypothetical protein AAGA34_02035 [Pseudomonadota bacterium]